MPIGHCTQYSELAKGYSKIPHRKKVKLRRINKNVFMPWFFRAPANFDTLSLSSL